MTQKRSKSYSFIWKIENFSLSNHKFTEFIVSPHFTIETLNHSKWYIKLYPKGHSGFPGYFPIFLYRNDDSSAKEEIIHYKLEAVDGNGTSLRTIEKENMKYSAKDWDGVNDFILCETLVKEMNGWKENVLTIHCDISSEQYDKNEMSTSGCKARTKIGIDQCSFKWTLNIPDLSAWREKKTFSFLPEPIEITVTAPDDSFEIHISKAIGFTSVLRPILCRFSLSNNDGKKSVSKCDSYLFESAQSDVWKFPTFLTKKHLENGKADFVQWNTFTLKCEISISTGTVESSIENYVFQSPPKGLTSELNLFTSLHDDLQNMFTLKKHCDVQLKLGDSAIPAHKAVLSARSPVFSAMFDQDMLENRIGVVNIDDVEASTMHDLLECIYTGSVKELNYGKASKLLIAADKYQILSLKRKCSEFLASILSILNVCDILSMAAVIDPSLKASAMDYIMKNFDKVMSSQIWSEWVKNNHDLTTEVFLTLSKCMRNGIENEYTLNNKN